MSNLPPPPGSPPPPPGSVPSPDDPGAVDAATPVVDWVEKGKAPESIVASRVVNNQVVRTRPLCPFPAIAQWDGKGDKAKLESFKCVKG